MKILLPETAGTFKLKKLIFYREVLRVLTGAPTLTLKTDQKDFLQELESLVAAKAILTASASNDESFGKNVLYFII